MVLFENYLVYPAPRSKVGDFDHENLGAEEVWFNSSDETKLHGWFFAQSGSQNHLVFFHGNGENVAMMGTEAKQLSKQLNSNILVFDYRGYGKSDGSPFEKGVVADGMAAVKWLCERINKSPDEITYLGRSLGGGVAVQVCCELPPMAMVLVSNFSSMVDVAAMAFPWLPVKWLMRNRFDSVSAVSRSQVPLLQIHGTEDNIIPIALGERLHAASPADNKRFIRAEGLGHNNLSLEEFVDEINGFVQAIEMQR